MYHESFLNPFSPLPLFQSPALVDFTRCHPTPHLNKSLLPHPLTLHPGIFRSLPVCYLYPSTGAVQECSEADLIATCSGSSPLPLSPGQGDPEAEPSAQQARGSAGRRSPTTAALRGSRPRKFARGWRAPSARWEECDPRGQSRALGSQGPSSSFSRTYSSSPPLIATLPPTHPPHSLRSVCVSGLLNSKIMFLNPGGITGAFFMKINTLIKWKRRPEDNEWG